MVIVYIHRYQSCFPNRKNSAMSFVPCRSSELTLNLTFYANHPFFKSVKDHRTNEHNIFVKTLSNHCADKFDRKTNNREYCLLQQAKSASLNFTWSPFIQLLVLASVIKRQIRSIYPPTKGFFETFFNATVHPREQSSKDSLNVLVSNESRRLYLENVHP